MGLDTTKPFSRAQAEAAGWSWRRVAAADLRRVVQGVYVDAVVPLTPEVLARAALIGTGGRGAICHVSAAAVLGLPVPVSEDVHLLLPEQVRVRRRGIVVHHGERLLSQHDGIPLTTAVETFVDVARDLPLVDSVALGDAIVREGYASPGRLVAACEAARRPRIERARRAAELVRPRVRLPQETRLRLLMVLSGIPEPVTGLEVTAAGRRRELDTAFPTWRVAVEYGGRHHVERDLQWSEDIERHEELDQARWKVVTVTGLQIWDPERVIARIRTALANAGAPLPPASQEWRRHFPTRRRPS